MRRFLVAFLALFIAWAPVEASASTVPLTGAGVMTQGYQPSAWSPYVYFFTAGTDPQMAAARTCKAQVLASTARCSAWFPGDSTTEGSAAGPSENFTASRSYSKPSWFSQKMAGSYSIPTSFNSYNAAFGNGLSSKANIENYYGSGFVFGTGDWLSSSTAVTFGGWRWSVGNASSDLTITPALNFDSFEIYYKTFGTSNAAGYQFQYAIDGTTLATVNAQVATNVLRASNTTTLGAHTFALRRITSAGTFNAQFSGVIFYDSTTKAIDVLNMGASGYTTADILNGTNRDGTTAIPVWLSRTSNCVVFYEIGINNVLQSVNPDTMRGQIETAVGLFKTAGCSVVVESFHQLQPSLYSLALQKTYVDKIADAAFNSGVAYIDFWNMPALSWTVNSANSWSIDGIHLKCATIAAPCPYKIKGEFEAALLNAA